MGKNLQWPFMVSQGPRILDLYDRRVLEDDGFLFGAPAQRPLPWDYNLDSLPKIISIKPA